MSDSHPVDVHVGKRLRLKRTIMGLSQESIGKAIGVTFQQIQKYERGINRMGASRLYDFAKTLNVPVSYFFEGFGDELTVDSAVMGMAEGEAPAYEHEQVSSRETMDIMRAYYKIKNPAVRKRIIELIKAVSEENADK
ncbi:MAG: helix-turn-helix transcriptional regulator [Alphaproteobacteria bacterium]|nr:helix-turn-helix transcriptional regulator [Alphaproteobacteria bacterium]